MGKATLARQRAIGTIGLARVQKLDEAGLTVLDTAELERLRERIGDLERKNKLLRDLALGTADQQTVAARVLQEAMVS